MERTQNRNLWIGLGVVALLLLFALPMFGGFGGGMMGGRGFEGYGERGLGGGAPMFMGLGLLFRLAIFGGILFFIVSMFRRRGFYMRDHQHDEVSGPDLASLPPIEILRRRYAAGEITREQFEEMRRTLETTTST
jgi:uncharacterized membrane protein